ncbi:endoplasmic reticulum-based factor for assembly of V-ATPase-domain-containing protein [Lipomyces oligophaga]|uniref:endoplasmic reticulum-based factor for assembly of V-ATPase-domain-containing protein n=1 Tax=Lipomyces oligophaga TaxID=45792 RepID=UPI0034CE9BCE
MPKLTTTPLILEAIAAYNKKLEIDKDDLLDLKRIPADTPFVTHKALARIAIEFASDNEMAKKYSLRNLLVGSGIYFPPKPIKKVDPEYEARMQKLRVRYEEQEYQAMIADTAPALATPFFEQMDSKEVKNQISVVINVLFSVVSVGYAVWTWGGANLSTGKRLLLSLFGALIVLVAEVTLYIGYLQRIDDARQLERRKKEVKTIINHEEFLSHKAPLEKKND